MIVKRKDTYCRVSIEEDGKMTVTMPDGTPVPGQMLTRISQDVDEYHYGVGTAIIKVMVNLSPNKA
jgi:hypothetical protein